MESTALADPSWLMVLFFFFFFLFFFFFFVFFFFCFGVFPVSRLYHRLRRFSIEVAGQRFLPRVILTLSPKTPRSGDLQHTVSYSAFDISLTGVDSVSAVNESFSAVCPNIPPFVELCSRLLFSFLENIFFLSSCEVRGVSPCLVSFSPFWRPHRNGPLRLLAFLILGLIFTHHRDLSPFHCSGKRAFS